MTDIHVPSIGESIQEVTLLQWIRKDGDYVERDEVIAELESEKASFEVNAEASGTLIQKVEAGSELPIGFVLAQIDETAERPVTQDLTKEIPQEAPPEKIAVPSIAKEDEKLPSVATSTKTQKITPLAEAILEASHMASSQVKPTSDDGKIRKKDVLNALQHPGAVPVAGQELFARSIRREPMSNLRKTISKRLVASKNTTAMLTTFNEVDMSPIMGIRKKYKEAFKESHKIGLGFMSFFSKACAIALGQWPSVNAAIDDKDLVYHDYADISIAVSTPRGLTVPVIRNVESLSLAEIERSVKVLADKARTGHLTLEELQGGTFTITNGGVFGSLLSTPIINQPQSAILGMHNIVDRPIAVNGKVEIRPMMYVALSYDHRVVDGRESVSFLVCVKELLEHPERLLMGKDPIEVLLEL